MYYKEQLLLCAVTMIRRHSSDLPVVLHWASDIIKLCSCVIIFFASRRKFRSMCVCIYACLYVFMHVCMFVCFLCIPVYMFVRMYLNLYAVHFKQRLKCACSVSGHLVLSQQIIDVRGFR